MPVVSKELRYAVTLGSDGRFQSEDGSELDVAGSWTSEHLMLAALVRCTIESLRYSARKAGTTVAEASGSARALVRKRDKDGRYAIVRADVTLDVTLEPKPERPMLADILSWAERGCFIGSSLTATPVYRWNVT
jgi:organic hydroperoxide reductase OsmC/OhrA